MTHPQADALEHAFKAGVSFGIEWDARDSSQRNGKTDEQAKCDAWLAYTALQTVALFARDGEAITEGALQMIALFTGPVVSFDVREPWYLASCDRCGWVGSTEQCPHDEEDVICPRCFTSGADCGKVAEALASRTPTTNAPVADREAAVSGAVDAEREACAAIADVMAAQERAGMAELTAQRDKMAAENAAHLAEDIATAIRARQALPIHGEMREALRPFAEACNISNAADDLDIDDTLAATKITWGDLRRARKVFQGGL